MMKSIHHNTVHVYPTKLEDVEMLKLTYIEALNKLKQIMELEEDEGAE